MRNLRKFTHDMVSKVKNAKGAITVGVTALGATASQAADITAPVFTQNQTDLTILLGAMIGFGAIVWGARKLLGFAG